MSIQHYRILVRTLVCVLLTTAALLVTNRHVQAFDGETCSATYQDTNQDGLIDFVVLDCSPGFATNHDRVTIYFRNRQIDTNQPWQQNVNFENEIWVFDVGALGRASLIVFFRRDGNVMAADLYDDQSGDGQVAYTLRDGRPVVSETPYWTVHVATTEGWWMRNGKINYNLTLLIDGPVLATFGSDAFVDRLSTDGGIDYKITVRDRDEDGRPDYELRNAYPPVPESWGVYRSILVASSREGDDPIESFIFWPYLGSSGPLKGYEGGKLPTTIFYDAQGRAYGIVKDYGASFPPVQIDWSNARINYVGEFVASHGSDRNWYIESISPIRLDELSTPNFENPFAFYDLAADGDGIPELQIRLQYFGPNDPYYLDGKHPMAYENVRYSWDQDNDQTWDYKVDLVGRHVEDTIVAFPEFSVRTIPYERLPYWATEKAWDVAAFVSWETHKAWTSEGIYEWGASREMQQYYIPGIADTPPITNYNTIAEGFRGEYKFEYGKQPMLYFSSLDHKLHLLNAEAGTWNVDGNAEVRYANLDGDAYLDQWQYLEGGKVRRQLNLLGNYLVYAGDGRQVLLKQVAMELALFKTLVPRNHEEWLALGQQLERYQREFGPGDFGTMVTQFEGPEWRVEGAQMRDFRLDDEGFRFILELLPGFQVNGVGGLDLTGLSPGAYVVSHHDQFEIQPLAPAQPEIVPDTLSLSQSQPVALESVWIEAEFHNIGLEDLPNLWIQSYAEEPGAPPQLVAETEVALLGGQTRKVRFPWAPATPGVWRIGLFWGRDKETLLENPTNVAVLQVNVAAPQTLDIKTIWRLSNMGQPAALALFLLSLGLTAAVLTALYMRIAGGSS